MPVTRLGNLPYLFKYTAEIDATFFGLNPAPSRFICDFNFLGVILRLYINGGSLGDSNGGFVGGFVLGRYGG